jgi:hypothetical protein
MYKPSELGNLLLQVNWLKVPRDPESKNPEQDEIIRKDAAILVKDIKSDTAVAGLIAQYLTIKSTLAELELPEQYRRHSTPEQAQFQMMYPGLGSTPLLPSSPENYREPWLRLNP